METQKVKHQHTVKIENAGTGAEITVHSRVASYGMRGLLRPIAKAATNETARLETEFKSKTEGMPDGAEKNDIFFEYQDALSALYSRSIYDQFYLIVDRGRTDKETLAKIDDTATFEEWSDLEDVSAVVNDFRSRIVV